MKHAAYPFIKYMVTHGRIGRKELLIYKEANWISKEEFEYLTTRKGA